MKSLGILGPFYTSILLNALGLYRKKNGELVPYSLWYGQAGDPVRKLYSMFLSGEWNIAGSYIQGNDVVVSLHHNARAEFDTIRFEPAAEVEEQWISM